LGGCAVSPHDSGNSACGGCHRNLFLRHSNGIMTLFKHTIKTEPPGYSAVETTTSIQPGAALHFTPVGVN
jgi:hypothetical protein